MSRRASKIVEKLAATLRCRGGSDWSFLFDKCRKSGAPGDRPTAETTRACPDLFRGAGVPLDPMFSIGQPPGSPTGGFQSARESIAALDGRWRLSCGAP